MPKGGFPEEYYETHIYPENSVHFAHAKVGTRSTRVHIHENDMPLEEGKVIRYAIPSGRASSGEIGNTDALVGRVTKYDEEYEHIQIDRDAWWDQVEAYPEKFL